MSDDQPSFLSEQPAVPFTRSEVWLSDIVPDVEMNCLARALIVELETSPMSLTQKLAVLAQVISGITANECARLRAKVRRPVDGQGSLESTLCVVGIEAKQHFRSIWK